jgi:hypothetical protein
MRKRLSSVILTMCLVVLGAMPAFAEAPVTVDWGTAFQPVQNTVMQAIVAAIGIGAVLFGVIFGIRKLTSVIRGMAGR